MNRSSLFAAKCCIPHCKNTSTNSRSKLFVHVREDIKERWNKESNLNLMPGKRLYCCEDHLNLEEDLENYLYWKTMNGRAFLKLTAKLRLFNMPTDIEAPLLKTELLKPLENGDCCEYGVPRHTIPTISSTSSTHAVTDGSATRSKTKMDNEIKTIETSSPALLSSPSSTSIKLPSKVTDSVPLSTTPTPRNHTPKQQTQSTASSRNAVPVCRACLAHNTRMFTILNTPLQKLFEKITGVLIHPSDGKPAVVCYVCHNLLRKCQKFAKNALKAQEVLQRIFKTNRITINGRSFAVMDTRLLSEHNTQISRVCSDVETIDIPPSESQNTMNEQIFVKERAPIQQTDPILLSLPFIPYNPGTIAVGSSLLIPEMTGSNSMIKPLVKENPRLVTKDQKLPRLKPATPYNVLLPPVANSSTVLAPSSVSHIITPIMINTVMALPSLGVAGNVCENNNKDITIPKNVSGNKEFGTENTGKNLDCTSTDLGVQADQINNRPEDLVDHEDLIKKESDPIKITYGPELVKEEPVDESQLFVEIAFKESTSENVDTSSFEIKREDDPQYMMDGVVIKEDETSWEMLEEEFDYEVKEEIIEIDETQLQRNSDSDDEPLIKKAKIHDISISDDMQTDERENEGDPEYKNSETEPPLPELRLKSTSENNIIGQDINKGNEIKHANPASKDTVEHNYTTVVIARDINKKPYVCKFCRKRFTMEADHSEHEKLHKGEMPYVCSNCTKHFVDINSFSKHILYCMYPVLYCARDAKDI